MRYSLKNVKQIISKKYYKKQVYQYVRKTSGYVRSKVFISYSRAIKDVKFSIMMFFHL